MKQQYKVIYLCTLKVAFCNCKNSQFGIIFNMCVLVCMNLNSKQLKNNTQNNYLLFCDNIDHEAL